MKLTPEGVLFFSWLLGLYIIATIMIAISWWIVVKQIKGLMKIEGLVGGTVFATDFDKLLLKISLGLIILLPVINIFSLLLIFYDTPGGHIKKLQKRFIIVKG